MPNPVLVFFASPLTPTPTFHFGTVTLLFCRLPYLCYLSGNLRLTNAYSGQNGT
jgi:hypothetical protein